MYVTHDFVSSGARNVSNAALCCRCDHSPVSFSSPCSCSRLRPGRNWSRIQHEGHRRRPATSESNVRAAAERRSSTCLNCSMMVRRQEPPRAGRDAPASDGVAGNICKPRLYGRVRITGSRQPYPSGSSHRQSAVQPSFRRSPAAYSVSRTVRCLMLLTHDSRLATSSPPSTAGSFFGRLPNGTILTTHLRGYVVRNRKRSPQTA